MKRILRESLDSVFSEGTHVFANTQREIAGDVGWHQHLGSDKIGIVATAMALIYYKDIAQLPCPKEEACIEFLKKTQQADGGWSFITNSKGISNVLATCWSIRALYKYEADSAIIEKAVSWLYSKKQKGDFGWSLFGTKSQTFPTCFCVMTLLEIGVKPENETLSSALTWLRNTVLQDGSWADSPDKPYQSLFHTALTILCLQKANITTDSILIIKGLDWIEKKFKTQDFSAPCYECDLELMEERVSEDNIRVPYFHFTLPYVALVFLNANRDDKVVFKCVRLLVERNEGGSWPHPFIENKKIIPIWTLYDGMLAIKAFKERMQRDVSSTFFSDDFHDPIGNTIVYYKLYRKKIIWVRTCSPIRLTDKIGSPVLKFLIVATIIAIIVYFALQHIVEIGQILSDESPSSIVVAIITSFIASVLYTVLFWLANWCMKWITEKE